MQKITYYCDKCGKEIRTKRYRAGWKVKDIAGEMRLSETQVRNAIAYEKRKQNALA